MKKTISNLLKNIFWILFFVIVIYTSMNIFIFYFARRESEDIKNEMLNLSSEIRQIEKEKNSISRQSYKLKNKQVLLIEKNKYLIEKNINLSNENLIISSRIDDLINGEIYFIVDTKENKLYVKKKGTVLREAKCSVGKGGVLADKKTGRKWEFFTPRGVFILKSKIKDPIWIKPDWAFIEEKKEIPLPGVPERKVEGEIGKYAIDLGFGYKIHGTKNEELLGRAASHGCIRLGADDLEYIFQISKVNKTFVYVY